MLLSKKIGFLLLLSSILFITSTSHTFAAGSGDVTYLSTYQINGPYASSGLVTDGDTISYTLQYTGSNRGLSGSLLGNYMTSIDTGACFSNLSITGSSILYFTALPDLQNFNPNLITNVFDCNVRAIGFGFTQQQKGYKTLVHQGSSYTYWVSVPNKDGQATYDTQNGSDHELYIWDGTQSGFVDSGAIISWGLSVNNSGRSNYYKGNNGGGLDLYIWDGTQSIFVDSGADLNWLSALNNNGQAGYIKNSNGSDYELYIWNGSQSVFVDSGTSFNWGGTLNSSGQAGYLKYDGNDYTLYIWNGSQSVFVNSGTNLNWGGALNSSGRGNYYKNNNGTPELYIWNGSQSVFVDTGTNASWSGPLNNNGQASYYKTTNGSPKLYIWDGSQSVFIDQANTYIGWLGALNNNGQGNYYKSDNGNDLYLYIWDGSQSGFVDSGTNLNWGGALNNSGQAGYYKENNGGELDLYIWNGSQSVFVDTGTDIAWLGALNDNGVGNYYKFDGSTYELYIYNGELLTTGNFTYDVVIQSGVTASILTGIVVSGYYGYDIFSLVSFMDSHAVYHPPVVPPQTPSNGGGGGGASSILADVCPNGDYSSSYYDGTCGNIPTVTGTAITYTNTDLYNTDIPDGYCYTRDTSSILDSKSISTSEEFKKALTFMYAYKMTMFRGVTQFEPYTNLTRQQAAKLFSNFATNVLCRKPDTSLKANYNDIADADPTLTHYINLAYELGLMKGGDNGNFRPFDTITKAEFNAVIVRMLLNSYLPENDGTHRYDTYNRVSTDLGIIKQGAGEVPVIRNDAALMLFRAYKNQKFGKDKQSFVLESAKEFIP